MTISPANEKEIRDFLDLASSAKLIREWHIWQLYKEGDVLIRQKRFGYGASVNWKFDVVSSYCPVPRKFKIVKIDELGIPWVKQISVRGGLGNKIHSLADSTQTYRYQQDPEMSMAILLGVDYEPRSQYKKWREDNPNYGGKISNS